MRKYSLLLCVVLAAGVLYLALGPHRHHPAPPESAVVMAAPVFFIDAEAGDDRNEGMAETSAWKTLARMQQESIPPGSMICLRRGQIWRESFHLEMSGVPEAPITMSAFGEGDAPSIRGSDTFNAPSAWKYEEDGLWYLTDLRDDPGMLVHDGLLSVRRPAKDDLADAWDFWYDAAGRRLYVRTDANPAAMAALIEVPVREFVVGPLEADHLQFQDLDLRHPRRVTWLGQDTDFVNLERCAFSQSPGTHIQIGPGSSSILVTGCRFDDWNTGDGRGYAVEAVGAGSGPVDVIDCRFTASRQGGGAEHTAIASGEQSWVRTVRWCEFLGNGGALADEGVAIRRPSAVASSIAIEDNVFHETGGSAIALQELDYHDGGPIVSIQRNRIERVCLGDGLERAAIGVWNSTSDKALIEIACNRLDGTFQGLQAHAGISIREAKGVRVFNNIVRGADDGILLGFGTMDAFVANNILLDNRGAGIRTEPGAGEITHNACHGNAGGPAEGFELDAGSIAGDPMLDKDLRPVAGSPCIDGGVQAGLVKDLDGGAVPAGLAPDIGAYEYGTPAE